MDANERAEAVERVEEGAKGEAVSAGERGWEPENLVLRSVG